MRFGKTIGLISLLTAFASTPNIASANKPNYDLAGSASDQLWSWAVNNVPRDAGGWGPNDLPSFTAGFTAGSVYHGVIAIDANNDGIRDFEDGVLLYYMPFGTETNSVRGGTIIEDYGLPGLGDHPKDLYGYCYPLGGPGIASIEQFGLGYGGEVVGSPHSSLERMTANMNVRAGASLTAFLSSGFDLVSDRNK